MLCADLDCYIRGCYSVSLVCLCLLVVLCICCLGCCQIFRCLVPLV